MDTATYHIKSKRTLSENFFDNQISLEKFNDLLSRVIETGNDMDIVKKSCFYGKPVKDDRQDMLEGEGSLKSALDKAGVDEVLFHAVLGIFTESVEMLEAIQKALAGNKLDYTNLCVEELGDAYWYAAAIERLAKTSTEAIRATNIAKLEARFPEKFTQKDAIDRDIAAERKILESHGNDTE